MAAAGRRKTNKKPECIWSVKLVIRNTRDEKDKKIKCKSNSYGEVTKTAE